MMPQLNSMLRGVISESAFYDPRLTEEECPFTEGLEGKRVDEKREKENKAVFKRTRLQSDAI